MTFSHLYLVVVDWVVIIRAIIDKIERICIPYKNTKNCRTGKFVINVLV